MWNVNVKSWDGGAQWAKTQLWNALELLLENFNLFSGSLGQGGNNIISLIGY